MKNRWTTVFAGPMWEVIPLQSELEARGFLTYVPDSNLKEIDPFVTGANSLVVRLQVPSDVAENALQIIEPEAEEAPQPTATPAGVRDHLDRVARRIRWGALLYVTAPLAFYMSFEYFDAVKRCGVRPSGHGYTVAAFWLATLWIASWVLFALVAASGA
jgi:hypothetical protein